MKGGGNEPSGADPTQPLPGVDANATRPLPSEGAVAAAPTVRAPAELLDTPERYQVGEEIARGGMGRILAARAERLARPVAIKEALDQNLYDRFEREARVTARLQHPGIVPVYSVGRSPEGKPFYAMKLVAGRPLDRVIAEATTFAQRLALLPNVIAVADALAYAHEERVIHRDLKPANVLCGRFGETVVIDWGLAHDLSEGPTAPGAPAGTPAYMPPEQARGLAVDERADVYAIGAMLYHVLSGAPPYRAPDETSAGWNEVRGRVILGPPDPLERRQPGLSPELVAIVARAMSRNPGDRYPSARELAARLREFQSRQLEASGPYWEYDASRTALIVRGVFVGGTAIPYWISNMSVSLVLPARTRLGLLMAGLILPLGVALGIAGAWRWSRRRAQLPHNRRALAPILSQTAFGLLAAALLFVMGTFVHPGNVWLRMGIAMVVLGLVFGVLPSWWQRWRKPRKGPGGT